MGTWTLEDLRRRDPDIVLVMGRIGFFVFMTVGDDVGQGRRQVMMIPRSQTAVSVGLGTSGMPVIEGAVGMGMSCVMGVSFRSMMVECQVHDQRTGQQAGK